MRDAEGVVEDDAGRATGGEASADGRGDVEDTSSYLTEACVSYQTFTEDSRTALTESAQNVLSLLSRGRAANDASLGPASTTAVNKVW